MRATSTRALDADTLEALDALVEAHGITSAARALSVSIPTLRKAHRRQPVYVSLHRSITLQLAVRAAMGGARPGVVRASQAAEVAA